MAKISLKHFLLLSVLAVTFAQKSKFTEGAGNFAVDLYKKMVAEHPQENVVINPINCFLTLNLLYLGSDGETSGKLISALNMAEDTFVARILIDQILENRDSESLFNISNNIFVAEGIKTSSAFERLADSFNVNVKHINFTNNDAAISQINDWIKEKSSSALSNIVQPNYVIDSHTTALILNAVSFKGKWQLHYYEPSSHKGQFWMHGDQIVTTPVISATFHTKFKDFGNFTVITIPYKRTDLVMLVVLPKERYGLSDLEENLKFDELYDNYTLNVVNGPFTYVRVQLPIFKSYFAGDLRSPLSKMNLGIVFDKSADFKSVGSTDVKFNEFIHKMEFSTEKNENKPTFGKTFDISFLADHPFLYFIISPRGYIYTMGRYIGPLDAKSKIV